MDQPNSPEKALQLIKNVEDAGIEIECHPHTLLPEPSSLQKFPNMDRSNMVEEEQSFNSIDKPTIINEKPQPSLPKEPPSPSKVVKIACHTPIKEETQPDNPEGGEATASQTGAPPPALNMVPSISRTTNHLFLTFLYLLTQRDWYLVMWEGSPKMTFFQTLHDNFLLPTDLRHFSIKSTFLSKFERVMLHVEKLQWESLYEDAWEVPSTVHGYDKSHPLFEDYTIPFDKGLWEVQELRECEAWNMLMGKGTREQNANTLRKRTGKPFETTSNKLRELLNTTRNVAKLVKITKDIRQKINKDAELYIVEDSHYLQTATAAGMSNLKVLIKRSEKRAANKGDNGTKIGIADSKTTIQTTSSEQVKNDDTEMDDAPNENSQSKPVRAGTTMPQSATESGSTCADIEIRADDEAKISDPVMKIGPPPAPAKNNESSGSKMNHGIASGSMQSEMEASSPIFTPTSIHHQAIDNRANDTTPGDNTHFNIASLSVMRQDSEDNDAKIDTHPAEVTPVASVQGSKSTKGSANDDAPGSNEVSTKSDSLRPRKPKIRLFIKAKPVTSMESPCPKKTSSAKTPPNKLTLEDPPPKKGKAKKTKNARKASSKRKTDANFIDDDESGFPPTPKKRRAR